MFFCAYILPGNHSQSLPSGLPVTLVATCSLPKQLRMASGSESSASPQFYWWCRKCFASSTSESTEQEQKERDVRVALSCLQFDATSSWMHVYLYLIDLEIPDFARKFPLGLSSAARIDLLQPYKVSALHARFGQVSFSLMISRWRWSIAPSTRCEGASQGLSGDDPVGPSKQRYCQC